MFHVIYCELKEFTAVMLGVVKAFRTKTYSFDGRNVLLWDFEAFFNLSPIVYVRWNLISEILREIRKTFNIRIDAKSIYNNSGLLAELG